MSDPQPPDGSSRPSIADAASLFDSNVVQAYNPPSDPEPPTARARAGDGDTSEYGIDASHSHPTPASPVIPPRAVPRGGKSKPARSERDFDPTADDDEPRAARPGPTSRSDEHRIERKSQHIDAETDSSDRVPTRSKRRSSERAVGFDDADDGDAIIAEDDAVDVNPIWTRGAEWGPDLVRVGLVAVGTLVIAWFLLGLSLGLTALILVLGGAACVLLSYPILITIERPVRITPEQAVKDFFEAASHHLPHYRRMWLLLSPTARSVGRFADFGEFRAQWVRRMHAWKEGKAGNFTPLSFRVGDFRGDKSVGQSTSHAEYTVQVWVRGHEDEKPIASYKMTHGLVRGPDRMWYLNQGTLTSGGR